MLTKLLTATTLALAACGAAPAYAGTSPYVEATATTHSYGAKAGLQTGNVTLEAGAENFLDTPTYVAAIGLQPRIVGPFSAYAQAGYLNRDGNSGYRLGGGAVVDLTNHIYAKGGYQRDDYGQGHSDAATFGLGVKF